jgi:alkenylglycerophosphocholine/alkenylglycerophosphoethanolamine hydrolase
MRAMTMAATILLLLAAAAAAADWVAVGTGRRRLELVTKPAVLALLLGAALAFDPRSAAERSWFAVALACSLAGDVALLVRGPRERRWFGVGLGFFLVAHLAYLGAFMGEQRSPGGLALGAVFVWAAGTLVGSRIVRGATAARGWRLGTAVAVYLIVISLMTAAAAGTGDATAAAGAVAFFASDGLLGWARFLRPLPGGRLPRRIAYHAGQALLVLSLLT